MSPRPIVRDPLSPPGTWIFAGTLFSVREVQRDLKRSPEEAHAAYRDLGLSEAELDAALVFALPSVQEVAALVQGITVEIHCVCGERRVAVALPPALELDACICGRVWRLPVQVQLARTVDAAGASS
jgi:hypothetical protein